MNQYLKVAMAAAKANGGIFKRHFGRAIGIKRKQNSIRNLVTATDFQIEKNIKSLLKKKFPTHGFYGEETGKSITRKNDYLWIVDPIDGTSNYIQGLPICSISIALWKKQVPLVGVVYNPINNKLYYAQKNYGSYLNGKKNHVSQVFKIKQSIGGFGWGGNVKLGAKILYRFVKILRKTRVFSSTSSELSQVGEGAYDSFIQGSVNIWDLAAGALIVQEAGGKITDWQGKPLTLDSTNFVASNGKIHQEILEKLKGMR